MISRRLWSQILTLALWPALVASRVEGAEDSARLPSLDVQSKNFREFLRHAPLSASGADLCAGAMLGRRSSAVGRAKAFRFLGLQAHYASDAALPKDPLLALDGHSVKIKERVGRSIGLQVSDAKVVAVARQLSDLKEIKSLVPECAITLSYDPKQCTAIDLSARLPELAPNDPRSPDLWGHTLIGYRWEVAVTSDPVVVALFDSGIDCRHPELRHQFWGPAGAAGPQLSGKEPTCPAMAGYDYVDLDDDAGNIDAYTGRRDSHGTQMAGVIAARVNNRAGVSGIAPRAQLRSYRIMESSSNIGGPRQFRRALKDAYDDGVRVFNLSVYGNSALEPLCSTLNEVSSGEGAALVNVMSKLTSTYPASCKGSGAPNLFHVAGVQWLADKKELSISNDADGGEFFAPGDFLWEMSPGQVENYQAVPGTSFAVAYVSGAAAQIWGTRAFSACNAHQMRELLLKTASLLTPCGLDGTIRVMNLDFLPALAEQDFPSCESAINAAVSGYSSKVSRLRRND